MSRDLELEAVLGHEPRCCEQGHGRVKHKASCVVPYAVNCFQPHTRAGNRALLEYMARKGTWMLEHEVLRSNGSGCFCKLDSRSCSPDTSVR